MKTATYLRLSLLLPFIVWGFCILLFFLVASIIPDANGLSAFSEVATIADYGILFLTFYVFGIVIWIFPYLLLSLILFFGSFIAQAQTMLKVFALSPVAMTILTLSVVVLMDLGNPGVSAAFSNAGRIDQDFIDFNLLVAALSFIWGYICAGIGFGIYKLLQRLGMIRDQTVLEGMNASNQPA